MAFVFKKIGLVGTHRNPLVAETVGHLADLLVSWGLSVYIENETASALNSKPNQTCSIEHLGDHCDLVIAVGGDGNLLHAGRYLSLKNVPVLGINRGQLGFLTDIKPDDVEQPLQAILKGQFIEEKRFLLEGKVQQNGNNFIGQQRFPLTTRDGGLERGRIANSPPFPPSTNSVRAGVKSREGVPAEKQELLVGQGNALNDIVLFPGDIAQLIEFEMEINGKFVYSQRSDGLIISTPTGSTAYALSAGGPIMGPELNVVVIVPKFPHTLTSRPLVVDADSEIILHVGDYNKIASRLSYDGQSHVSLNAGDKIIINKQKQALRLIHPAHYDYYAVLRTKLQWGTQLIPIARK